MANLTGFQKIKYALSKNSPTILTGIGVAGVISTTGSAIRDTPQALDLIEQANKNNKKKLTKFETVKLVAPCYIPTIIMGTITIACIIGSNSINGKRNAALATIYSISEAAMKEYQAKVVETIGAKKERQIKDEITKDLVANNPVEEDSIIHTGRGTTLCYDSISGRYFRSNIENIRKAVNDLNRSFLDGDMYISLNELYYSIGLPETKLGNDLGWPIGNGNIELDFSSHLTADGTPCLVMDYKIIPIYDFDSFS